MSLSIPTRNSGDIVNDLVGRSWEHLYRFYARNGTSLRAQVANILGDTVNATKLELLARAASGRERPSQRGEERELGGALARYTDKNRPSYDGPFHNRIRTLAPSWFFPDHNERKKTLLRMAACGTMSRPTAHTLLGKSFRKYTTKGHMLFDRDFTRRIKTVNPDWMLKRLAAMKSRKQQLLSLARRDAPRPAYDTSLGNALSRFTNKGTGTSFDSVFNSKIRKLRPNWFVRQPKEQTKNELLALAKAGVARPHQKDERLGRLGRALTDFTSKSKRFDAALNGKLRKLAPHWFKFEATICADKRRKVQRTL